MMIVGHRGARGREPENTLRSFRKAVECGVEAIEFDVRFNADRIPVVIHDETLDRTTNGRGRVARHTLRELKSLDAGRSERIPTLDESLDFAGEHHLTAFVELKEHLGVDAVVESIQKRRTEAVLISFIADNLKYLAYQNTGIPTGLIFNRPIRHQLGFLNFAHSCGASWLLGRCDVLNSELVSAARKQNFRVEAWVANDREEAARMSAMGVDAIATDYPDVVR